MDSSFNWPAINGISNFSDEIVNCFESQLNIKLIDKEQESNLCYNGSDEVRDEYKTFFTTSDILHYIYALKHSSYLKVNENALPGVVTSFPYPRKQHDFLEIS